jgi:hypothetical protein
MKKQRNKTEQNILPGNDAGLLSGSAPQQGVPVREGKDKLSEEQPSEPSQQRKPINVKTEKLKKNQGENE